MNQDSISKRDVFMTIQQIAKALYVVPATIRNWEKAGLFTPQRLQNNYRIYTLDDLETLKKIRELSVEQKMSAVSIKNLLMGEIKKPPYLSLGENLNSTRYSRKLLTACWKESRENMGLSLEEVSQQTGIDYDYLQRLEEGLADIRIEPLNELAIFYGESILHFFEVESEDTRIVRKGKGELAEIGLPGVRIESMISQKKHVLFPALYTVEPGCGSGETHRHHGEEFIHILSGELSVTLNYDEEHILKRGDSMFFKSYDYHSWRNPGTKSVKLIWVHSPVEANG